MFCKNLKVLRLEKGYTQKELCNKMEEIGCPISRSTYAKYETGDRNLPCDVLIKLAYIYNTSCDYILGIK